MATRAPLRGGPHSLFGLAFAPWSPLEPDVLKKRPHPKPPQLTHLDAAGRPYVIDVNPNPNLAYGEDFAESAETAGVTYERLLERIIGLGLRWEPARTG